MFLNVDHSSGTLQRFSPFEFETTAIFPQAFDLSSNQFKYCDHCGCYHQGICSRIKSVEYYRDGTIKKIEYHDSSYSVNINFSIE